MLPILFLHVKLTHPDCHYLAVTVTSSYSVLISVVYSIYNDLSHVTPKSLTSVRHVYCLKVLRYAVGFDCSLALLLFGKGGTGNSERQMKDGGSDVKRQTQRTI